MTVKEFLMLIEKDIEAWKGTKVGKKDILFSIFDYKILIVWIYRISHFLYQKGYLRLARFVAAMNLILFGIEIGVHVKIGGGFRVHHPVGIVLGAQMIGENFNVFAGAGCGGASPENREQPIIGNNIFLYAGAKVLGDITIGDNVVIGANAVVLQSVPANSMAVGVPARVLPRTEKQTA